MIMTAYHLKPDVKELALWLAILNDMPEKDFALAVMRIICNKPALPGHKDVNVAALIRENVKEMNTLSAEEAWAEVTRNIKGTVITGRRNGLPMQSRNPSMLWDGKKSV